MRSAHPVQIRSRHRFVLALLATTAAATLLGACSQTDKSPFGGSSFAAEEMDGAGAVQATHKWAEAYAKRPNDPKIAIGYAKALKAIGSKDKAVEVLTASYRADQANGEVAAELGRAALDAGRMDVAEHALKTAETKGIKDWRTLSAQGTLRAKKGEHAQAQQYFLAALQEQPDAVPVINNLALSYALDGKAGKAEDLLRKATASGHDDRRVRQNLALVLGLQGKFGEARQVASADMKDTEAKSNMAFLQNMVDTPTNMAALPEDDNGDAEAESDWTPFAEAEPEPAPATAAKPQTRRAPVKTVAAPAYQAPVHTVAARSAPAKIEPAKVMMVTPTEETTLPGAAPSPAKAAAAPAPTSIVPKARAANSTATAKTAKPGVAPGTAVTLLRSDVD